MSGESPTSPRRVRVALRRADILRMRAAGATPQQILERYPEDYKTTAAVCQDLKRAMVGVVHESVEEMRALEAYRLDMLWQRAMRVLSRTHVSVSNGKIVYVYDQEKGKEVPLQDDMPILAAIRELRELSASRRKLFGLDAPAQVQVMSDDAIDKEIQRLTAELERAEAHQAGDAT